MQKLAQEQGCTILMVTHANRILDIADRIVYMENDRLAAQPDTAAILHQVFTAIVNFARNRQ